MSIHVVGAAIVRDGRVLTARRSRPAALAGRWEFPGGKVEEAESEHDALIRECREELGLAIQVGARLGAAADGALRLVLFAARTDDSEPTPLEDHDLLRWLSADELHDVEWLPIDVQLLPAVAALLNQLS